MKSKLLILFLLCTGATIVAQPRLRDPEMYIGIHGGALASIVNWYPEVVGTNEVINHALLTGNGGLVFRYAKHKYCGLQVEINYMQRGWRENGYDSIQNCSVGYTRRLDYIEVPFLAHIYFGSERCRGFINLGPQLGYCFHESDKGTKHLYDTVQYAGIQHPFDWGVAGGIGLYARTRRAGLFQLEARFNYSMGNLFDNDTWAYFDRSNTMSLSLNIAYMWEIKPKTKKK